MGKRAKAKKKKPLRSWEEERHIIKGRKDITTKIISKEQELHNTINSIRQLKYELQELKLTEEERETKQENFRNNIKIANTCLKKIKEEEDYLSGTDRFVWDNKITQQQKFIEEHSKNFKGNLIGLLEDLIGKRKNKD